VTLQLLALALLAQSPGNASAARLQALDATCQAGRTEKCLEAGRAHLAAKDPEGALGAYAKACNGRIPEACLGLASRYAGLAREAKDAGREGDAAALAEKGLSLVRQAQKQQPNLVEAAEYEGILCRVRAAAAHGKSEADTWTTRARDAETRATALRAVMGPGDSPDLFWRPERR
jgi:hypothetical protein